MLIFDLYSLHQHKIPNPLFCDFEFTPGVGPFYRKLICAVFTTQGGQYRFNLMTKEGRDSLRKFLKERPDNTTLISYGIDAEVKAINTLFKANWLGTVNWNYICLFRAFRLISNRNREMVYGEVISKKSKVTRKFLGGRSEDNKEDQKYTGLLNALWKLCGVFDEKHVTAKDVCTMICARGNELEINRNLTQIINYCAMDTDRLPSLLKATINYLAHHQGFTIGKIIHNLSIMGAYGKLIGLKEMRGYPINYPRLRRLTENKSDIMLEIITAFKMYHADQPFPFTWADDLNRYKFNADVVRSWILKNAPPQIKTQFGKTAEGKLSLESKTFERIFPNKHSLDLRDYLQAVYKYLYTASALKGLDLSKQTDLKKAKKMGDFYDPKTSRMYPRYNDYGSQTGRSQPPANGYLMLKPAWTRVLIEPPKGHCLIATDWSQQEILINAVLSEDQALIRDYASAQGIYVAFGQRGHILPTPYDEKNKEQKIKRDMCKQAVLSIQYGISKYGLSNQLSLITGYFVAPATAQQLINKFFLAYPKVAEFQRATWQTYRRNKRLTLSDGWTMWGANYNERSVKNFPVQGTGAIAMRYADMELADQNIFAELTVHDALMTFPPLVGGLPDFSVVEKQLRAMRNGFMMAMENKPGCELIESDAKIVWPDYHPHQTLPQQINVDGMVAKLEYDKYYVDKRAIDDLKLFGKYF